MNSNWTWMLGAPAIVAPLLWMCASTNEAEGRDSLVRVQSKSDDASTWDENAWKTKLTQKDLAQREREFDRAIDAARHDDGARRALEAWAKDDKNPDLAWTSRLALRELERRPGALQRFGQPGGRTPQLDDLRSRFDDLQRQFGGLDSLFEDLQSQMDRAFSGSMRPGAPPSFGGSGGGSSHSSAQSYSMQVMPDGVKVTITEEVDGKQETKEYSAKTLDDLYEAHPELRDKLGDAHVHVFGGHGGQGGLGAGSGARSPFGGGGLGPGSSGGLNDDEDQGWLRPARPLGGVRTDILGIQAATPTAGERAAAKLDDAVGVKVDSVVNGSIASQIAIQPGDILVEVNGQPLKSVEDVRKIMRERKRDADVAVTLVDPQGQRRTLTWRAPISTGSTGTSGSERRF